MSTRTEPVATADRRTAAPVPTRSDPTPTPALVRRRAAARMVGMGLSTFDRADVAGLVPAGRWVRGCKLWSVAELEAWADHGCPDRKTWAPIWAAMLTGRRTTQRK
ncbi:MAG TPA: hypothetical protein VFG68_07965 [Fimbriiglobus sp.]|nr:hypothetical protein [Fimbriiglobus sp.]